VDQRVDQLIDQLSSDDATQRQSAAADLVNIGLPARPAILRASRDDDPTLRDQAAQILLQLPWYLPTDPLQVQILLRHYGIPDISQRRQIIYRLIDLKDPARFDVLVRLLSEDPSIDVRWTIVGIFRRSDDLTLLNRFSTVDPPQDDAPMLALCAYACLDSNPDQARKYLNRCADLEFSSPSDDNEFDYVVQMLCDFAVQDKQYAAAADLRRKQYARGSPVDEDDGTPTALLELFALQADYGPLPGLSGDLQLAGSAANGAKIQYCLDVLYTRTGKPRQADAARAIALAASHTRIQRCHVGEFLSDHGWDDLAEAEFNQMLAMPPDPSDPIRELDVLAHFHLADDAIKRGDDLAAAKNEELALRNSGDILPVVHIDNQGRESQISAGEIWPEVHWHYLRAAQAKHDEAQITSQLDQLLALKPTDPEIAIDVVPLLIQRGQPQAADSIFNAALDGLKTQLAADPHNPDTLNSLAWLCAECDRDLPQALDWSQQAVAILPRDAAAIDTLADVNYRLGHAQKAVELETKALQYEPGDSFMTTQLARFRAAAATQPSAHPN
jgi:tetratricopeptide (TPR) repeat protein